MLKYKHTSETQTKRKGTKMTTAIETVPNNETLKPLTGDANKLAEGSFVFTSQGVASEQGFRNVSKLWYPQTMSFEQGLAQLEAGRAQTEDIMATVGEMRAKVDNVGN